MSGAAQGGASSLAMTEYASSGSERHEGATGSYPRVPLGASGLVVSRMALGTYNFGGVTPPDEARRIIQAYEEEGGNFIDTGNTYNNGLSEELVGISISGRRQKFVVATKVGWPRHGGRREGWLSSAEVITECEKSLKRLGTDWIDLYQLHRPDPSTPIEETLAALDRLIHQGKVRYAGSSMFSVARLEAALAAADRLKLPSLVSEQAAYNLLDRRAERALLPFCRKGRIAVCVWSPLAGGILTGKYASAAQPPADSRAGRDPIYRTKARLTEDALRVTAQLEPIVESVGTTRPAFAVAWLLWNPDVASVIVGPRTVEHLREVSLAVRLSPSDQALAAVGNVVAHGYHVADYYDPV